MAASDLYPCDPNTPNTDQGRRNSSPWTDPAGVCPIAIPNNTGEPAFIDGELVFLLGPGIGSAPGGGPDCPPVPVPDVAFLTDASSLGSGVPVFYQMVNGVLQFYTLGAGTNITLAIVDNKVVITAAGLTSVAWADITGVPSDFTPSAHQHFIADVVDAGSAAGTEIADYATAAQGATADAAEPAQTAASQAEMEAGTEAAIRKMSPLRVAQAIAALAGGGGSVATDTIWDAAGDMVIGTGANTAGRVAIGTNGKVWTSNGTTAAWAAAAAGSFDERDAWLLG